MSQSNPIDPWFERPLDHRAPKGGEEGVNGHHYKGGEFLPFYVPRPVMPQIEHHDLNALIRFVREKGVWARRRIYTPLELHNHQRINWDASRWKPQLGRFPVLVSVDKFILDGNHRWYGHLKEGTPVPVVQFGLAFEPAIALLFKFPRTSSGARQ